MNIRLMRRLISCAALFFSTTLLPAAAADDSELLKTKLTPTGAERAASADGKIPAWTGGFTTPLAGADSGHRADPFPNEKPMFSIAAADIDKYADALTDGQKYLLKKYPEYRLDVYPTHRTYALPQAVYDNIAKNATRAKLVDNVPSIDARGGLPFPLARTGEETILNHAFRYEGQMRRTVGDSYTVSAAGQQTFIGRDEVTVQFPYYMYPSAAPMPGNDNVMYRAISQAPALKYGQELTVRFNRDPDKAQGWVLLTGQHRVRKLPNACCDTPLPNADGALYFDEAPLFSGRTRDFDWKLIGKREMFIPYNDNRANLALPKDFLGPHTVNPNIVRWELHRVYVIEADLKPGHRHVAPKSVYYLDEDSWTAFLADRYDARGNLARTLEMFPSILPEVPTTIGQAFGAYDLTNGSYTFLNIYQALHVMRPLADNYFTPEAMAGESVR